MHARSTRFFVRSLVVATALALPIAALASPAGAATGCLGDATDSPDGRINVDGGQFSGQGQFPNWAYGIAGVDPGEQRLFGLRWKNISGVTKTIRVLRVEEARPAGYTVRYFLGGENVTKAVKQGKTFVFKGIAAGKSTPEVSVLMRNKSANPETDELRSDWAGRYGGSDPTTCDGLNPLINY